MSDDRRPLISIIVPVFNEERNISLAHEAIRETFEALKDDYRLEILFSDNNSTDGTEDEIVKLAYTDPDVKYVRLARNYGFQRSVMTAYRLVSGDAAIQIDCDLQDPTTVIPEFLKLWSLGHDVVVGIRRKREEARLLQLCRKLFYRLVRSITDENILEDAGDFRLVDRTVLDRLAKINDTRPYTRGLISLLAVNQTGVPYDRAARQFESSKFPLRRLIGLATDGIVSHSLVPLRLAAITGVAVFFAAFGLAAYYIISYLFFGASWPPGFATLSVLLLVSVGFNGIFSGIVGEYVGRIYDQVRERPQPLVERSINLNSAEAVAKKRSPAKAVKKL